MFLLLLIAIGIVSFFALKDDSLLNKLSFSPYKIAQQRQWYRFLSHVFVHSSVGHLLINVFVFYTFGSYVESTFQGLKGNVVGLLFFFAMLAGSAIFSSIKAYAKHQNNPAYHAVGASGIVSAVLFSFVLMQPLNSIYLFFIPIPIPAFIFGICYLAYEYFMDKKSSDKIAHDAHFYGAVFGILFTIFLDFQIPVRFVEQVIGYFS